MNSTNIKFFLFLGLLGATIVGIGEYLLHFLPSGPGGEITMLEEVPLQRASKGHFLAIIGVPLYFAGYYGLRAFFTKTSTRLANALFVLGILAFWVGGVWISSRYFAAEVLQKTKGTANHEFFLQSYEDHYQILVWVLRIIVAALSVVYVWLILSNKQGLPKWLAILNPIVLLIIVISSLVWLPPLGIHIAPIAMNVTHFIFFGVLLFYVNSFKIHH